MSSMFRVAALVTSSGVLSAVFVSQRDKFKAYATSQSDDHSVQTSNWDSNWDRRRGLTHSTTKGDGNEAVVSKPTATRTLILIRHGQYESWHDDRDKHVLTTLGREQSELTGKRLKELNEKYSVIHYSTMPRATETAEIVCQSLPDVPTKTTDILREGAPIRPDPPSKRWKPDEYVSLYHTAV